MVPMLHYQCLPYYPQTELLRNIYHMNQACGEASTLSSAQLGRLHSCEGRGLEQTGQAESYKTVLSSIESTHPMWVSTT